MLLIKFTGRDWTPNANTGDWSHLWEFIYRIWWKTGRAQCWKGPQQEGPARKDGNQAEVSRSRWHWQICRQRDSAAELNNCHQNWFSSWFLSKGRCWSLSQLHMGKGRLHPWMCCQLTALSYVSIWEFGALLKGAIYLGIALVPPHTTRMPYSFFNSLRFSCFHLLFSCGLTQQ